jgi:hypothetical protein
MKAIVLRAAAPSGDAGSLWKCARTAPNATAYWRYCAFQAGVMGPHLINESSLKVVDVDGIHWAATSVGHLLSLSQIVDIRVSFMNVGMILPFAIIIPQRLVEALDGRRSPGLS